MVNPFNFHDLESVIELESKIKLVSHRNHLINKAKDLSKRLHDIDASSYGFKQQLIYLINIADAGYCTHPCILETLKKDTGNDFIRFMRLVYLLNNCVNQALNRLYFSTEKWQQESIKHKRVDHLEMTLMSTIDEDDCLSTTDLKDGFYGCRFHAPSLIYKGIDVSGCSVPMRKWILQFTSILSEVCAFSLASSQLEMQLHCNLEQISPNNDSILSLELDRLLPLLNYLKENAESEVNGFSEEYDKQKVKSLLKSALTYDQNKYSKHEYLKSLSDYFACTYIKELLNDGDELYHNTQDLESYIIIAQSLGFSADLILAHGFATYDQKKSSYRESLEDMLKNLPSAKTNLDKKLISYFKSIKNSIPNLLPINLQADESPVYENIILNFFTNESITCSEDALQQHEMDMMNAGVDCYSFITESDDTIQFIKNQGFANAVISSISCVVDSFYHE